MAKCLIWKTTLTNELIPLSWCREQSRLFHSFIIIYTEARQEDPSAPKISTYAFGEDYHLVIKEKLKILLQKLNTELEPG